MHCLAAPPHHQDETAKCCLGFWVMWTLGEPKDGLCRLAEGDRCIDRVSAG